jgi:aspartyl-tRNA(Asn)/glutamyl-tRNA(Gln) amidotransferase subunit B
LDKIKNQKSKIKITNENSKFELPNYKVELKNINSFRFLAKAVKAEIERQEEILSLGENVAQETRGFDEATGKTYLQRSKEEAKDYRYFPEPDLPPIRLENDEIEIERKKLPELPSAKRDRYKKDYQLPEDYINILVEDCDRAEYFEEAVKLGIDHGLSVQAISGLMVNKNLDKNFPEPAGLIKKIVELTKKDYASTDEVDKAVTSILAEQAKAVADYQNGKGQIIGFLIGQVQKALQGRGNPKVIQSELLKKLQNK